MNKIKVLSEEVSNRIAAGEVIERPVSIVKELVENSIDAGADKITVIVEKGGKKLIQVIDNGCGMSEDDAIMSFERHATSKIRTVSDIFHISSLGFRGEALPSIASVSRLTLITKEENAKIATKIEFDSGRLKQIGKVASNKGTTITIEKLFNFIPARKKFLKSEQIEYKHIVNFLHYQAILYPKVQFRFISNGKEKFNYPAVADYDRRLYMIFGKEIFERDLLAIDEHFGEMHIHGYISGMEDESEGLTNFRYLFVNNRFIKDKIVFHSIMSAYEPFVQKLKVFGNKMPPFLLFLNVAPDMVDFNVHPAKLEIRFVDSFSVHSFVKDSIRKILLENEESKFETIKRDIIKKTSTSETKEIPPEIFKKKTDQKRFSEIKKELSEVYQPELFKNSSETDKKLHDIIKPGHNIIIKPEEEIINPWQLHNTYIFVQVEDGLMIIDQHAAHERILYEKLLKKVIKRPDATQKLLFPLVIDIPPYLGLTVPELIAKNLDMFITMGFGIKTFSGNSVVIEEIPVELEEWSGGEVFLEILKELEKEFEETHDFRDSLSKSVACKSAIKAGKRMTKREMVSLINDLFKCEVPYFCPHGRPLIIKMTLLEFEKRFRRTI